MADARVLVGAVLLALAAGCGARDGDAPAEVRRPAVVLDDGAVTRLLRAMAELRDLSRAHPQAGQSPTGALPVGLGITALLGPAADEVVARHGFDGARDFESALAHAQLALQRLELGEHGGFDGLDRTYKLKGAIQEAEERLQAVTEDEGMSRDQKKLLQATLQGELEQMRRQLDELAELASSFKSQYGAIPQETLAAVGRRREALLALLTGQPSGG